MVRNKLSLTFWVFSAIITSFAMQPQLAHAVDVESARIVRLGIDPRVEPSAGPMVQLEDEGTIKKWTGVRQFYLSPTLGNSGYATMLTAFSMGQPVWVRIAGDASSGSLISIIFVNAP